VPSHEEGGVEPFVVARLAIACAEDDAQTAREIWLCEPNLDCVNRVDFFTA
jgi:hypothetical protein